MKDRILLDSNIIVYCFDESDAAKRRQSRELVKAALAKDTFTISSQVVQEVLNTVIRKSTSSVTLPDLLSNILLPLCVHYPDAEFYPRALDLQRNHKLAFYDALILQSAVDMHCSHILSEDFQDGTRIKGVRIVNPFATKNRRLLAEML